MTIRELLDNFADYSHSNGHINFGYRGDRHLYSCMDHEVQAWVKNRYTCLLFSETTRKQPMCYAVITHDVDLIPFSWVRLRAFRIDWLDGRRLWDNYVLRPDMTFDHTDKFIETSNMLAGEVLAEFSGVIPHLNMDSEWRKDEVNVSNGTRCRLYRRKDGGLESRIATSKYHGRAWPITKSFKADARTALRYYEDPDYIFTTGKLPKKLLDELKVQAVAENI